MNPITHGKHLVAATLVPLVGLLLAGVALAAPASATAYRYWSYWQGASGAWEVAQTGPGGYSLVDRDVQGWRFGISTENATQKPDNAPDFASLCPDLAAGEAPAGKLRVAVVIDSGFVADAPNGQRPPADAVSCVTVPEGSSGYQALAAAGNVREQAGMACAINNYPADECGAVVGDQDAATAASAAATEQPNPAAVGTAGQQAATSPASPRAMVLGLAALAGLVGTALMLRRRRGMLAAEEPAFPSDRADTGK